MLWDGTSTNSVAEKWFQINRLRFHTGVPVKGVAELMERYLDVMFRANHVL